MATLKWIAWIALSILGISIALGAGVFVLGAMALVTVVSAGLFGIGFVAFCIKEWWGTK